MQHSRDSCTVGNLRISTSSKVIDELLSSIEKRKKLDIRDLRALEFCLSNDLVHKALDIVYKKRISLVIAKPSGRHYFCVNSERKMRNPYICFHNYCSCIDFAREVLCGKKMFCKHMLAIRFSSALSWKDLTVRHASDSDLGVWLHGIFLEAEDSFISLL